MVDKIYYPPLMGGAAPIAREGDTDPLIDSISDRAGAQLCIERIAPACARPRCRLDGGAPERPGTGRPGLGDQVTRRAVVNDLPGGSAEPMTQYVTVTK